MNASRRLGVRGALCGCALVVLTPHAFADATPVPLRLAEVITAALDHGSEGAHADIKLKLAEAQLQQAQGAFDWRATARAGWSILYYPKSSSVGGVNVLTSELDSSPAVQVIAGASKQFSDGISIQPGFSYFPEVHATRGQTMGLTRPIPTLNLDVPLLHAFDEDNLSAATERAAAKGVIAATFELNAARQQSVLDAVQVYWRCLAAQDVAATLQATQAQSAASLQSMRALAREGQIKTSQLDQATAKDVHDNSDVLQAIQTAGQCMHDLVTLVLAKTTPALPTFKDAFFVSPEELSASVATLDEEALSTLAMRQRSDIQAAEQYVAAASDRLAAARAAQDPKVDLTLNPDGVFLSISKSIEANTEDGAVAESEANLSEAQLTFSELKGQIERNVGSAVAALRDSLKTLAALVRLESGSGQVLRETRAAYNSGSADTEELRAAEDDFSELHLQVVQAYLDSALNLASLRFVTGTIDCDTDSTEDQRAAIFLSAKF